MQSIRNPKTLRCLQCDRMVLDHGGSEAWFEQFSKGNHKENASVFVTTETSQKHLVRYSAESIRSMQKSINYLAKPVYLAIKLENTMFVTPKPIKYLAKSTFDTIKRWKY